MADPISEQIAAALATRLAAIDSGSGYELTAAGVTRPKLINELSVNHLSITIVQGTESKNDALSYPGNPPGEAWDLPFVCSMVTTPDQTDTDSIDEWRNQAIGVMKKAIQTPTESWQKWGGLALNSRLEEIEPQQTDDGEGAAAKLSLLVTYRHPQGNPYTTA